MTLANLGWQPSRINVIAILQRAGTQIALVQNVLCLATLGKCVARDETVRRLTLARPHPHGIRVHDAEFVTIFYILTVQSIQLAALTTYLAVAGVFLHHFVH
jgi:hypothetical protein